VTTIAAPPTKAPVLIPFVCPVCAGANAIELLVLSRAGGTECVECGKHLRSADVMRAIHSPRAAPTSERRVRAPIAKKPQMVWPPTAESRAAIAPLRRDRSGDRN
jgi:Zn ribbon nucleic-acid-binding protein